MKSASSKSARVRSVLFCAALGACAVASAQDLDQLKSQAGGLLSSHSGSSSLVPSSLSLGSAKNAAGVLSYCQSQGYLPNASSTIKDKLLGKLGGSQQASADEGYQQGAKGLLQGSNGKSFDLSNIKGKLGKKLCKSVAEKAASSFLGH